eukprot:Skav202560  [mRNA]  locus=scaffold2177:32411:37070:+ [translate_table: standard]
MKSEFKYCVGGFPVPHRSDKTLSGAWRGVAAISKHPTRLLPHAWSDHLHKTSRIQVCCTLLGSHWITSGVFYGESQSHAHPNFREHNDILLQALVDQVCHLSHGPRLIAGDFNLGTDEVAAQQRLRAAGFQELQDIAWNRWGIHPSFTYKQQSRIDYVWISPELQALLRSVHVQHDVWTEHSVLYGTFEGSAHDIPRFIWPTPACLPWPSDFQATVQCSDALNPTQAYRDLWKQIEVQAFQQVPGCPLKSMGRATRVTPKKVVGQTHAPLRSSRRGEADPHFHSSSLMHSRWFKQLRRLQSYKLLAQSCKPDLCAMYADVWGSIKRAKGFVPDFGTWWEQSEHKGQLKKKRVEYARIQREENPNLIFKDIRQSGVDSVDLLVQPRQSCVEELNPVDLQVVCTKPVDLDPALPIYHQGRPVSVIHVDGDSLWLDSLDGLRVGSVLTQTRLTGHLHDLFAEFEDAWEQRWQRHTHVPPSQAVRMSAWPKGLHGVAAATVSPTNLKTLRSGAMRGLQSYSSGVSSIVHLSCVEEMTTDPGFWLTMQTFRTTRECADPVHVRQMLGMIALDAVDVSRYSITNILQDRIHALGWSVQESGALQDAYGSFDLFSISFPELRFRAERGWLLHVANAVQHRYGYQHLSMVDLAATRKWLQMLSKSDAGAFRKILNGAFFTSDTAKHWNDGSDLCKFCNCSDGRYHRFWVCEAFSEERTSVTSEVWQMVPTLPDTLTGYGWSLHADTYDDWLALLAGLPDFDIRCCSLFTRPVTHVFTDGSCMHQHDSVLRYAAWSIIQYDGDSATVVASDVLPGLIQTAFRAELYAVTLVCEIGCLNEACVYIYCDNKAVVRGLQRLLRGGRCKPNSPNYDLWHRCEVALKRGGGNFHIQHVLAHRVLTDNSPEAFLIQGNRFADQNAQRTNFQRDARFWTFYQRHTHQVHQIRETCRQIQAVQLRVSRRVFLDTAEPVDEPEPPMPSTPVLSATPWVVGDSLPVKLRMMYGADYIQHVATWLTQVEQERHASAAVCPQQWVSAFQLFVDFQMSQGHPGPIYHHGRWDTNMAFARLVPYDFKVRTRWWTRVFVDIMTHWGNTLVRAYTNPASLVIMVHAGSFVVSWPQRRLDYIDRWFSSHLKSTATRAGHALKGLPSVGRDVGIDAA